MKYYVLYNKKSGNNTGESGIQKLEEQLKEHEVELVDVLGIKSLQEFIDGVSKDEAIVLAGGDGTLCHFINDFDIDNLDKTVYYYATGSGNDFLNDIGRAKGELIDMKPYFEKLPTAIIKGKKYRFINDIGYGIDGYCCEEGDRIRAKNKSSRKPINYTLIALKGLLFDYKPKDVTITVDGVTHEYKKAWLAPTMNGRYFGGGMMAAPDQDRLNKERKVTVITMFGKGRIGTLLLLPSIFTGAHVKKTKVVKVFTGNHVKISYSEPCPLQIDGETIKDVPEYEVFTGDVSSVLQEGVCLKSDF